MPIIISYDDYREKLRLTFVVRCFDILKGSNYRNIVMLTFVSFSSSYLITEMCFPLKIIMLWMFMKF